MRRVVRTFASFIFTIAVASVTVTNAQDSWSALSVSAGYMDFDLSGTGQTTGVAIRATRSLTPNIVLEVGSTFARPCQQFQDCKGVGPATLFAPEAQLEYHWALGRVEPYVGGGIGASALRSSFHTDWEPTVSFGAGTGVRLSDQLALTGEFRVRGHHWRFVGTTTEVSAGLAWRLPTF